MATNLLAPNGLSALANALNSAGNYQQNLYTIKQGYATTIGMGDVVKTGTGTNQGYLVLATPGDTAILGMFGGVLPYYDATAQQTMHGVSGSYPSNANPNGPVSALVCDDPFQLFMAQVSGVAFLQAWRGQNIGFASNGAPNASGRSTLYLDASTISNDPTLPFRIVGVAGVAGGPQDPNNINPWIAVRMNTAEVLQGTGI